MDDKPEGVLRSDFLPENVRGGTRLFLSFENGWYRIHTRFENFRKRRTIEEAETLYEEILFGTIKI